MKSEDHAELFKIFTVANIHVGHDNGGAAPGWIMGAFQPMLSPMHSDHFEIKEWNNALVRADWRDHAGAGPEYVRVVSGTLTIHLSESKPPSDRTETKTLEAGQSIVLAAGLWRRFEASDDASGLTIRARA